MYKLLGIRGDWISTNSAISLRANLYWLRCCCCFVVVVVAVVVLMLCSFSSFIFHFLSLPSRCNNKRLSRTTSEAINESSHPWKTFSRNESKLIWIRRLQNRTNEDVLFWNRKKRSNMSKYSFIWGRFCRKNDVQLIIGNVVAVVVVVVNVTLFDYFVTHFWRRAGRDAKNEDSLSSLSSLSTLSTPTPTSMLPRPLTVPVSNPTWSQGQQHKEIFVDGERESVKA